MLANTMSRSRWTPVALTLAIACALGACKKDDAADAAAPLPTQKAAPAPTPESVVSASISAMGVDQLRDAANKAYNDNRLYAPAGDNAMEFYLALRDKQPGDAGASSALTDLLPMTVIATEQGIARDDFDEAKRLVALIGKADANHPALARLKASISSGEAKLKQQIEAQKLSAEDEAKRRAEILKQREDDQRRQQEQQRQQQAAAEQQRQQQAAAAAEAERQQQAEAEQQRQQQAEAARRQAAARQAEARKPSNELVPISMPGPRFPPAAQRAGATATVQVEFTVGTDGSVTNSRVVSSEASRQFQRDFEREALGVVRRWTFKPIGQATTTRRTIEFK